MIRYFITLLILISYTQTTNAQKALYYSTPKTFEYGPRIGFTTSMVFSDREELQSDMIRWSLMGGFFTRYQVTERFSVQLEADYTSRGGGFNSNADTYIKLSYLDIPATAIYNVRYRLFKMPMTFDLFAGVEPSFLLTAKQNDESIDGQLNQFSYDIVIGSGFPMWRFLFYATTKIGMSNINRSAPGMGVLKNMLTEWSVSYRFGGKNAARAQSAD